MAGLYFEPTRTSSDLVKLSGPLKFESAYLTYVITLLVSVAGRASAEPLDIKIPS